MNSHKNCDISESILWKHVVDKIPLRIYGKSVDDDMRYVLCSDALCEELNLSQEKVLGRKPSEIFPPKVVECFEETTRKTLELNGTHTENEWDFDLDGIRKDLRTTETVFTMPDGRRYVFGYCVDVTEDNSLQAVEQTIYEVSSLSISCGDFLQNVFDIITRQDRLDVVELRWRTRDRKEFRAIRSPETKESVVFLPSAEEHKKLWQRHYADISMNGIAVYTDFPSTVADISEEFSEKGHKCMAVLPVRSKTEENVGDIVLFFREPRHFTARYVDLLKVFSNTVSVAYNRIKALRELELQLKRAEEAERAKSFFFASVSHDIRTPLNSIIGFGELLKSENLDVATRRQYVDAITSGGQVLMKLINDVLDLAKLEVGKLQFEKTQTDFRAIVNEISTAFMPQMKERGLEFRTDIERDLPYIEIDSQRIRQVLYNLVGNAIKFTDSGVIEIAARFTATDDVRGEFSFGVIDSGRGISEEDQKRLMQPFVQLIHTDQGRGTGLGLAICRQLIERMGGEFTIDSEVGIGSLFKVKFRNVSYSHTDKSKKTLSITQRIKLVYGPKKINTLRFLLVDDVELNLQVLKSMLNRLGVKNLVLAHSGEEALEILNRDGEKFDSVLTDMWMPKMGGEELARIIRSDRKFDELPIYAVTADVEIMKTYEKQGFAGYLLKPVSLKKLSEHLDEYCK